MFWVRWRNRWMVARLLWHRKKVLQPHDEEFVRKMRGRLRNYEILLPRQQEYLSGLYDRLLRSQRR
jgi:hypothetical protein